MRHSISITTALAALLGILTTAGMADDSIFLVKKRIENSNTCHLTFPAIRRDTLFTQKPQLQDPKHGELINFYGSCDHDPLGEAEVKAQRREVTRKFFSLIILGAASGKK